MSRFRRDSVAASLTVEQEAREQKRRNARTARWNLRRRWREVTGLGVGAVGCGQWKHGGADVVTVRRHESGSSSYGGVQTCGSVWACPVCSGVVRQKRADELERGVVALYEAGGMVDFGTFTIPHGMGDQLADSLGLIKKAWTAVLRSEAWARAKKDWSAECVRAVETTYGWNGWHPHVHALIAFPWTVPADQLAVIRDGLQQAWTSYVAARWHGAPSDEHGVRWQDVTIHNGGVGKYLSKVQDGYGEEWTPGQELARGDLKRGRKNSRTPFEVLHGAVIDGAASDLALWHEYEDATRNARCLTFTRGFRELCFMGDYATDEMLAEGSADDAVVPEELVHLTDEEWVMVKHARRETLLLDRHEREGAAGVRSMLNVLRRRQEYELARAERVLRSAGLLPASDVASPAESAVQLAL